MAGAATGRLVFALEREASQAMVIADCLPAFDTMAIFAATLRQILIDLVAVGIAVTIKTSGRGESETDGLCAPGRGYRFMAGHAGHGQVTSQQGVSCFLMFIQREVRGRKTIDSMTFFAFAMTFPVRELPLVVIGMAVGAEPVF